ncbi:MAG TPA: hypothetical protein VF950_02780 [Planctomycetota bacterium]
MNGRLVAFGVLIVIGAVASVFTLSSHSVVAWNDKAVGLHQRCEKAIHRLEPVLDPYLQGRQLDEEKTDAAYLDYASEVHIASRELGYLTAPDDPECRKMQDELIAYIDFQKSQVTTLGELIEEMKAANPPAEEDVEGVKASLKALESQGKIVHNRLEAQQRAVAAKFGLKLR